MDPLDGRGSGGRRRSRAWVTWLVVALVVGVAVLVNRQNSSTSTATAGPPPVGMASTTTTRLPSSTPPPTTSIAAAPAAPPPTVAGLQRPGQAVGDVTGQQGEPLALGDAQVLVHSTQVSERNGFRGPERLLTATVTVTNTATTHGRYSALDWSLQHPDGHVTGATPTFAADELEISGGLIPGGSVTGTVSFEAPSGVGGDHFVLFSPSLGLPGAGHAAWLVPLGA